ncbi:TAF6-like RNA polymerase II p300/CBP-associated factor-associated factor 65 kDa subunit 6L isoform X1 [Palaemon carinicauda]|uniref:TAF6-like RNA polymerase II p300/CBP-associated factor-associated factor 65 kDa subunit 6L isoform X1 n=1 Tax=Palaemon carinicauda TaxID=392227 RepID=UPI0035B5A2BD
MVDRNENRVSILTYMLFDILQNDDKRCAQIAVESIITWGESVGIVDLSQEVARAIAADATYRLRQSLNVCGQFLRHSKRRRLTPDDVNRSLKWMDVQGVAGYTGSEPVEWMGVGEVGVYIPNDPTVNLASTALSGDIFHQPGSPCVRGEWLNVSGHNLVKAENSGEILPSPQTLPPAFVQYYQTLFTVIAGPSNDLFKMMCEDVSTSPGIRSFVGHIIGGVVRGANRARQKPFILRRLLLITRALLVNPHIHLGPQNYMRDIINVLVYCLIIERKLPQDTQMLRSLACNVLLQVVSREPGCWETWETVVTSLSGVVASSSRPWGQHIGALIGLLTLGSAALLKSLTPIARPYHNRLMHAISKSSTATSRDVHDAHTANGLLLAGLVKVMTSFIKGLPDHLEIASSKESSNESNEGNHGIDRLSPSGVGNNEVTLDQVLEIYRLGEEAFGQSFVVQVPCVYMCCTRNQVPSFLQSSVYRDQAITGDALLNPPPTKRAKNKTQYPMTKSKPRRGPPVPLSRVFEGYKPLSDKRDYIPMNIRGCCVKSLDKLVKKERTFHAVIPHPHRKLLARYCSRITGCMPHNTFTRPLYPPLKPGYSMQYLIL